MLGGLQIGAPPDLFNANGQNWGLTLFSPRALHGRALHRSLRHFVHACVMLVACVSTMPWDSCGSGSFREGAQGRARVRT